MVHKSVQIVYLIDRQCFNQFAYEFEKTKEKIYLCCLRLLTEFGAQSMSRENIRWAFKFYNSKEFKPDFSRKTFSDFNVDSIKGFEDAINRLSDQNEIINSSETQVNKCSDVFKKTYPHSYIINKSLQEILLDYDWDDPDVSSPVDTFKSKSRSNYLKLNSSKVKNEISKSWSKNFVVLFTRLPRDLPEVCEFIGDSSSTYEDLFKSIFDPTTLSGFKDGKKIALHIINFSLKPLINCLKSKLKEELLTLKGNIHEITSIIQCTNQKRVFNFQLSSSNITNSTVKSLELNSIAHDWFKNSTSNNSNILESGPLLVWEDCSGISFVKIKLEVISLQSSYEKHQWVPMHLKYFVRGNTASILGIGLKSSLTYICFASDSLFPLLLSTMMEQKLTMILQLECGQFVTLGPWFGGVGCLVLFSVSDFPIQFAPKDNNIEVMKIQALVEAIMTKTLKGTKCISTSTSYCDKLFQPQMLKSWFPPSKFSIKKTKNESTNVSGIRQVMFERLQKRYRPQLPRPLSSNHPAPSLIDMTQPGAGAATPVEKSFFGKKSKASIAISKRNASRGQDLMMESFKVTAQLKQKLRQAEDEKDLANSRKTLLQTQNAAEKSVALMSDSLKTLRDPQDKNQIVDALKQIREGNSDVAHSATTCDLYPKAQAIVNLTIIHIKTHFNSNFDELRDILTKGVLMSAKEINGSFDDCHKETHFKLQVLLHLEALWILGYSSSKDSSLEDDPFHHKRDFGEQFVEEILKILRMMCLKFSPALVGQFLQDSVVPNFHVFLGEILVEIFEELNLPLPSCLASFANYEDDQSPLKPCSVKSYASSLQSNGPYSSEDRCIEGMKRKPSKILIKREPSNRQIVVPKVRRTRTDRTNKNKLSAKKDAGHTKISRQKSVCRNLFEGKESKTKLKRCHTIDSVKPSTQSSDQLTPAKELINERKGKRKRSNLASPFPSSGSKYRGERGEHATTPVAKKPKLLVPETPHQAATCTIYTKQQLKKSNGTKLILESPDIKGDAKADLLGSKSRLSLTRKSSFYSGGVSRNFERGQESLKASHIQGPSFRKNSMPSDSKICDSSFLFSGILQSNKRQDCLGSSSKRSKLPANEGRFDSPPCRFPEKRQLPFELDEFSIESCDVGSNSAYKTDFPCRNVTASPSVHKIRRSLSLDTPKKSQSHSVERSNQEVSNNNDCDTPSKKVTFSFLHTPSKNSGDCVKAPTTPKSILKTPSKSPSRTPAKSTMFKSAAFDGSPFLGFGSPNILHRNKPISSSVSKESKDTKRIASLTPTMKPAVLTSLEVPSQLDALLNSPITSTIRKSSPAVSKTSPLVVQESGKPSHSYANNEKVFHYSPSRDSDLSLFFQKFSNSSDSFSEYHNLFSPIDKAPEDITQRSPKQTQIKSDSDTVVSSKYSFVSSSESGGMDEVIEFDYKAFGSTNFAPQDDHVSCWDFVGFVNYNDSYSHPSLLQYLDETGSLRDITNNAAPQSLERNFQDSSELIEKGFDNQDLQDTINNILLDLENGENTQPLNSTVSNVTTIHNTVMSNLQNSEVIAENIQHVDNHVNEERSLVVYTHRDSDSGFYSSIPSDDHVGFDEGNIFDKK